MTRNEALARLRATLAAGRPIIGAGAGTGISAKQEEAGGVDLIVVYNSGRFRMAGWARWPGCCRTAVPTRSSRRWRPRSSVLSSGRRSWRGSAGPTRSCSGAHFLGELHDLGYSGIQNFPTVGLIDGQFRKNLEETGIRFDLEVDCVAEAHAMDLLTTPYVFDPDQARQMADAGADIVIAHMGLTTSGTIGAATAKSLLECVDEIRLIADAARSRRPDIMVLCHGGPLAMPEDAQYVLDRCPEAVGFYGASSMERLPVETAIAETARRFKQLTFTPR